MPVDPTISLHAGDQPTGVPVANPLGLISNLAQVTGQMNQNKLFTQSFAAKQKLGQIMASAPDIETGWQTALKDPTVAPFAGEALSQYRQAQMFGTQQAGMQQEQNLTGVGNLLKGTVAAGADPNARLANAKLWFSALSPAAQKTLAEPFQNFLSSINDNLSSDPATAQKQVAQKVLAMATSVGISPAQAQTTFGEPGTLDTGSSITPTLTNLATGQLGSTGGPIAKGIPPQVTAPGQASIGGTGGGIPASNLLTGNASAPAAQTTGASTLGVTPVVTHPTGAQVSSQPLPAPAPASTPAPAAPIAGDGRPLFGPNSFKMTGQLGTGTGGAIMQSANQAALNAGAASDFTGAGAENFQRAQTALASLRTVDNDLDSIAHAGGFTTPGSLGTARASISKFGQMVNQVLGNPTGDAGWINPNTNASIESLQKETGRLGPQVLSTLTGQNHQAAQTISDMTKTVPSLDNTYLGGKLVSASLQAMAQRTLDQRQYQTEWAKANQGQLFGSDAAFAQEHPAQDYAQGVLDKFGLNSKGFNTPQDVGKAHAQGYLTTPQAEQILHSQFNIPLPAGGQ